MDDEHAHGSATRGFFILVGPAAVVGERLALEEALVVRGGLVDDDEGNFALHVDILAVGPGIVVPVVLWSVNAVSDEDNGGIEVGAGLPGLVLGDDLCAVCQIDGISLFRNQREFGFVFDGMHGHQGNALKVGAIVSGWLDTGHGELGCNVFGGQFRAARAGAAAFQQVKREKTYMGAHLLGIDGCGGCARGLRQTGNFRDGWLLGMNCDKQAEGKSEKSEIAMHGDSLCGSIQS